MTIHRRHRAPEEPAVPFHTVRGLRVLFDAQVAELYAIDLPTLRRAVLKQPERFPPDCAFVLLPAELEEHQQKPRTLAFTAIGIAMCACVLRNALADAVLIALLRSSSLALDGDLAPLGRVLATLRVP